jgi:hypothetical protein
MGLGGGEKGAKKDDVTANVDHCRNNFTIARASSGAELGLGRKNFLPFAKTKTLMKGALVFVKFRHIFAKVFR